jgi:hypothetical protein
VDIRSLRPNVVEVSLERFAENFRAVQAAVAPAAVMPIPGQRLRSWEPPPAPRDRSGATPAAGPTS